MVGWHPSPGWLYRIYTELQGIGGIRFRLYPPVGVRWWVAPHLRPALAPPKNSAERAPGVYVALVTATRSDGGIASEALALAVSADARVL